MKPKIHSRRPPGNKIIRKKTKQTRKKQTRKKQTRKKNTFVKKTRRKQRQQKQRTRKQKRRQTGGKPEPEPEPTLFNKIDAMNEEQSMPTTEDARKRVKQNLGIKYLTPGPTVQPTGTYTGTSSEELDKILEGLDTIPEG